MPACFKKYGETRIVLDSTEISLQKSECLQCRLRTYSHYKSNHTIKFLIGISPTALITYVSNTYGGCASDKQIFNQSNLLKLMLPDDSIMVDKGFLIEKQCALYNVKLIRPPFLKKENKQFSNAEAEKSASIAAARVHVERTIQRLNTFLNFKGKNSTKYEKLRRLHHDCNCRNCKSYSTNFGC